MMENSSRFMWKRNRDGLQQTTGFLHRRAKEIQIENLNLPELGNPFIWNGNRDGMQQITGFFHRGPEDIHGKFKGKFVEAEDEASSTPRSIMDCQEIFDSYGKVQQFNPDNNWDANLPLDFPASNNLTWPKNGHRRLGVASSDRPMEYNANGAGATEDVMIDMIHGDKHIINTVCHQVSQNVVVHIPADIHQPLLNAVPNTVAKPLSVHVELAKFSMGMAVAVVIGLCQANNIPFKFLLPYLFGAFTVGFALSLIGLVVHESLPKVCKFCLATGICLTLVGFFSMIGCFFPPNIMWVPALCCILSMVAIVLSMCKNK